MPLRAWTREPNEPCNRRGPGSSKGNGLLFVEGVILGHAQTYDRYFQSYSQGTQEYDLWLPSRYVTSQLGQLSLASFRGRLIEYQLRLG